MEFFVQRVSRNVFDVFQGKQWGFHSVSNPDGTTVDHNTSWSRLKGGHSGVYVAKGQKLSYETTKALAAAINPQEEKQLVVLN